MRHEEQVRQQYAQKLEALSDERALLVLMEQRWEALGDKKETTEKGIRLKRSIRRQQAKVQKIMGEVQQYTARYIKYPTIYLESSKTKVSRSGIVGAIQTSTELICTIAAAGILVGLVLSLVLAIVMSLVSHG